MKLITIGLILSICKIITCLLGYDCHHKSVKFRPISLHRVEACPSYDKTVNTTHVNLHLLQLTTTKRIYYQQCGMSYRISIFHCGMHSHMSAVRDGIQEIVVKLDQTQCYNLIRHRIWTWDSHIVIKDLVVNSTNLRSFTYTGTTSVDSACKGGTLLHNGNTYNDVVSFVNLRIILREGYTTTDLDNNLIKLPSGSNARYSTGYALDMIYGDTFWSPFVTADCDLNKYVSLYSGAGILLTDMTGNITKKVVTVESQSRMFSLEIKEATYYCNILLYQTDHPRLHIGIQTPGNPPIAFSKEPDKLDISLATYVNAKLVYVEQHIRTQITTLYQYVLRSNCELERRTLVNLLSLAFINEDEFAYGVTQEPGHTAVRRGEIIYLVDCIPVPVLVRETSECYSDLPITYLNRSMFLSPKNSIIKGIGEEIECMSYMPVWYYLTDGWYNVYGGRMTTNFNPNTLGPSIKNEWSYIIPNNLASSGLYSQKDLDNLETGLLFPGELEAAVNTMSRAYTGQTTVHQGIGISGIMTQDDIAKISKTVTSRMWGFLQWFGEVSSGFIGVYLIIRFIKFILSSFINGTLLYKAYGFSARLLGCLWNNLTTLLLYNVTHGKSTPEYTTVEPNVNTHSSEINPDSVQDSHVIDVANTLYPTATLSDTPTVGNNSLNPIVYYNPNLYKQ